ncbi:hypothetical protein Q6348_07395 [Isoptericola sp. b441]|uniref:HTH marR-type domain-containing protein n=1 Tax=Actinotalea lenta TaxID=3064654 RepID=A0ABT9DDG2_9CELL|nr:hypothetical protein [Isoptericola sp. b441]MDO8107022.1 hypothetical protein [Isoptericola sp. b441]
MTDRQPVWQVEHDRTQRGVAAALVPYGLTPQEYLALSAVVDGEACQGAERAPDVAVVPTDPLLRELEKRGLVDSTPDESSGDLLLHVRPTDAGSRIAEAAASAVADAERRARRSPSAD